MQQVLNYSLFKNDQLATGIINRAGATGADALFVYLARFPELRLSPDAKPTTR